MKVLHHDPHAYSSQKKWRIPWAHHTNFNSNRRSRSEKRGVLCDSARLPPKIQSQYLSENLSTASANRKTIRAWSEHEMDAPQPARSLRLPKEMAAPDLSYSFLSYFIFYRWTRVRVSEVFQLNSLRHMYESHGTKSTESHPSTCNQAC